MAASSFKIAGYIAGARAAVAWTEGEGFTDPSGLADELIAQGEEVCGTPTGPCFAAAATPGVVAMLTALAVFDRVIVVKGGESIIEELRALMAIPEGSIA